MKYLKIFEAWQENKDYEWDSEVNRPSPEEFAEMIESVIRSGFQEDHLKGIKSFMEVYDLAKYPEYQAQIEKLVNAFQNMLIGPTAS